MSKLKMSLTLKTLLERFPKGIAISPSGQVFEIVAQSKTPQELPMTAPKGGGFLVIGNPIVKDGDEKLFVRGKID